MNITEFGLRNDLPGCPLQCYVLREISGVEYEWTDHVMDHRGIDDEDARLKLLVSAEVAFARTVKMLDMLGVPDKLIPAKGAA